MKIVVDRITVEGAAYNAEAHNVDTGEVVKLRYPTSDWTTHNAVYKSLQARTGLKIDYRSETDWRIA